MRTNIDLNETLLKKAFQYTDVKTKKALVELALEEFILHHQRKDPRELVGKVEIDEEYDHKSLRD